MEVFQLTTVNPIKSTTTSMYYSSDLNLNIQIGDQDEIELVGRKGLVGQHTHLPRHHQLHNLSNNFNRHIRHDSLSHHNHSHSHLSSKDDEDAGLRRISYIKATKEDRLQ